VYFVSQFGPGISVSFVGQVGLWKCLLLVSLIHEITNSIHTWECFCNFDALRGYSDAASHI
jgi:hypothetical protein